MLLCIFLPLLISWLFAKLYLKRTFLTYLISGGIVILIPIAGFITGLLRAFASMGAAGAPDTAALATGLPEVMLNLALTLFLTLFFQYIFNKTFRLPRSKNDFSPLK